MAAPFRHHALEVDDVLTGLRAPRKYLPARLLHDRPLHVDYRRRLERGLLVEHGAAISSQVGPRARVIEPAPRDPVASRALLAGLDHPTAYVPIDLVPHQLTGVPEGCEVSPVIAEPTHVFDLPVPQHATARSLVFYPGSAIGRFEPGEARSFLAMIGRLAGPDRLLLLGADATRDTDLLLRTYDDDGATIMRHAFDRLAATRGATFDPALFQVRATWNGPASRVEVSLVSTCRQIVQIDDEVIGLGQGEAIELEHCYQHTPAAMQALLVGAGWRLRQVFTAREAPVRLWLCEPLR